MQQGTKQCDVCEGCNGGERASERQKVATKGQILLTLYKEEALLPLARRLQIVRVKAMLRSGR